jgi:hypothetical protein
MCNLYSITTNQAAIIALCRVVNRHVGNLPPMPGVFPDYPAPVIRNTDTGRELAMMRWGMPPPPRMGGPPVFRSNQIAEGQKPSHTPRRGNLHHQIAEGRTGGRRMADRDAGGYWLQNITGQRRSPGSE